MAGRWRPTRAPARCSSPLKVLASCASPSPTLPDQPTASLCGCSSYRDDFRRDDDLRVADFLRAGDFRVEEREDADLERDFAACSGLPLRLVEANSSSCFSLIDLYMPLDAPLSLLGPVLPRLAESAAPAAFCCAADFVGMIDLLVSWLRPQAPGQRAIDLPRY